MHIVLGCLALFVTITQTFNPKNDSDETEISFGLDTMLAHKSARVSILQCASISNYSYSSSNLHPLEIPEDTQKTLGYCWKSYFQPWVLASRPISHREYR